MYYRGIAKGYAVSRRTQYIIATLLVVSVVAALALFIIQKLQDNTLVARERANVWCHYENDDQSDFVATCNAWLDGLSQDQMGAIRDCERVHPTGNNQFYGCMFENGITPPGV